MFSSGRNISSLKRKLFLQMFLICIVIKLNEELLQMVEMASSYVWPITLKEATQRANSPF